MFPLPPSRLVNLAFRLLVLPPVPAVVEDDVLALLAVLLLEERDLVSESELDELRDMQMALHRHLRI